MPASIIAYNYSRCAMNSKPLRRKATPIFIPLGNLKLILKQILKSQLSAFTPSP